MAGSPMSESDSIGGTRRATQRPAGVTAPEQWASQPSAPPAPQPISYDPVERDGRLDPVRYGDWEKKGIAIDF